MSANPANGAGPVERIDHLSAMFPIPSFDDWLALVEQQLKGAPFEKKVVAKTDAGIAVQPLYRREDLTNLPYLAGWPGFTPYLRGRELLGYRQQPWLICQELPDSSPQAFNQAARHGLARGQTALSLALDQAEPDTVGRDGLSISTLADLDQALAEIDLAGLPLYLRGGMATFPLAALYLALVRARDLDPETLCGGLETDPLADLVGNGSLPVSTAQTFDQLAALLPSIQQQFPRWTVITVHGQPYSDNGGSAVQELAFVLATAVEYLRQLGQRGLTVDRVASSTRISLSLGSDYFVEVAKLRAARLLWAKVIRAFGGNEAAQRLTLHVRTTAWNKTIHDPYVNLLRTTTEAFAGAVGGVQSMHVAPFDAPIRPPDEFSRRLARNIQLILQEEAHLTKVIDPAGGSWYVEQLTDAVARAAWQLFQQVEALGGMTAALQGGFPQQQIAEMAAQRIRNLATRQEVLIGANKYPQLQETPLAAAGTAPPVQAQAARSGPQQAAVVAKLAALSRVEPAAWLAAAADAAVAGATLGELAASLYPHHRTPTTITAISRRRAAEPFEGLRAFALNYQTRTGTKLQVFLANLGPISSHKPRADFAADFFQVGGFAVLGNTGFNTPAEAARAALNSGAPVVVICGVDQEYPEVVPPLTQAIKAAQPETIVVLAGYPSEQIEAHRAAGVDTFIHRKTDLYETLSRLQQQLAARWAGTEA